MTNSLDDTVPFLLFQVGSKVAGAANADYQTMGINLLSARVLIMLLSGSATVGALSKATRIDQPTLSNVVQRLARDGWVKKERQNHDNRLVQIALSHDGHALARRCMDHNQRFELLITDSLSAAQRGALKQALKQMFANTETLLSTRSE